MYVDHEKSQPHNDTPYQPIDDNDPPYDEENQYPFIYNEFYGRVWLDSEVISFWRVPTKPRTTGKNILDIESYSGTEHEDFLSYNLENDLDLFDYYMKELKRKLVKRGFVDDDEDMNEWYIEKNNKEFIKVKDFTGGFLPNEEEYKYHLMKITDPKRKNRVKNYLGKPKPLKWRQALLKSENLNDDESDYEYYYGEIVEYKVTAWNTANNQQIGFTNLGKITSRHFTNNDVIMYKVEQFTVNNKDDFGAYVNENDIIRSLSEEEALIYIDSEKYNI